LEDEVEASRDGKMVDVAKIVGEIVEGKFLIFRQQLDLDLLPIKMAIKTHEEQIREIRLSSSTMQQGQARTEGKLDSFVEEQRSNHRQNLAISESCREDTAELVKLLHSHIGEDSGADKQRSNADKIAERESEKRRSWVKVGIGVASSGGIFKWLHDHWHLK
jgi:hypothetical protein